MHITQACLAGMKDSVPQKVHVTDVISCHIAYCTGCFACKRNGGSFIHYDDRQEILKESLEIDLLPAAIVSHMIPEEQCAAIVNGGSEQ